MLLNGKIIEIKTNKNGYYIFNFFPLKEFHNIIPPGGFNTIGTYCSALGFSDKELQKGNIISIEGDFKINNYKANNYFASKFTPKLNFYFNKISILEGLNNEEGLKDFIIKEIPYIGEKLANNIFKKYTSEQFLNIFKKGTKNDIILELQKIEQIGKKKAEIILKYWNLLEDRREIYSKLFKYGLSVNKASKIYDVFGKESIKKIEKNPYCITQIKGIGFKQAEDLAIKYFNIPKDSINRYTALIDFQVQELCKVDTLFSIHDLKSRVKDYLINDDFDYKESIDDIIMKGLKNNIDNGNIVKINENIYMLKYYKDLEIGIFNKLKYQSKIKNNIDLDYNKVEGFNKLTNEQKNAVKNVLENGLSIILGQAGTGKTTTTKVILNAIRMIGKSFVIISPTNKAVKRIKEVNKFIDINGNINTINAYTIHSLLGLKRGSNIPKYNENNPLPYDYVIIDESGMMGEFNAFLLLKALSVIGKSSNICYIGDNNQLASVESGSFFNDIVEGILFKDKISKLSVVKRNDISNIGFGEIIPNVNNIVANSQRILEGKIPIGTSTNTFCKYYEKNDLNTQQNIIDSLKQLYTKLINNGIDYNKDYQILCPNYGGKLGIDNLNIIFSEYLNSKNKKIEIEGKFFREGDKIYYDNKNEEYGLVKGDTGIIKKIDTNMKLIKIYFYDLEKEVLLPFSDSDNIKLGYCMSIHKSQGSEFDYVSLIITSSSYLLLNTNILYTGYTRGKKKVFLFGDKLAMTIALNNKESARNTLLFNLICEKKFDDIEITKTRELKGITPNQVKFSEEKLNKLFNIKGQLIKIKSNISELIGFKYIYGESKYLIENGLIDNINIDLDFYNNFRFSKDIKFIRIDNSGNEPNGFYKSKVSNNFNHYIISLIEKDNKNTFKIYGKKNIINNVFSN